jgi:hypothetical protein
MIEIEDSEPELSEWDAWLERMVGLGIPGQSQIKAFYGSVLGGIYLFANVCRGRSESDSSFWQLLDEAVSSVDRRLVQYAKYDGLCARLSRIA